MSREMAGNLQLKANFLLIEKNNNNSPNFQFEIYFCFKTYLE